MGSLKKVLQIVKNSIEIKRTMELGLKRTAKAKIAVIQEKRLFKKLLE
jgi:hypothetical protein